MLRLFKCLIFLLLTSKSHANELPGRYIRTTVNDVFVHPSGNIIADVRDEYQIIRSGRAFVSDDIRLYYGNPKSGVLNEIWYMKSFKHTRVRSESHTNNLFDKRSNQKTTDSDLLLFSNDFFSSVVRARITVTHSDEDGEISSTGQIDVSCQDQNACFTRDQAATDQLKEIVSAKEINLLELPEFRAIEYVFHLTGSERYFIVDFDLYKGKTASVEILEHDGSELKILSLAEYSYDTRSGRIEIKLSPDESIVVTQGIIFDRLYPKLFVKNKKTKLRILNEDELTDNFFQKMGLNKARYAKPDVPSPCDLLKTRPF